MADAVDLQALDLGYLALFVGQRINELVLDKLADDGFGDLRVSHGYVVQHLIGGPRTITELAGLLGVTQQAASKVVAELIELGYIESAVTGDRRARAISLSERGHASVAHTRKTRAKLQHKLVAKHGAAIDRTREVLAQVLDDLGGAPSVRARRVREPR
jgi:DNA-binding MarR family transcriptional regulator